MPGSAITLGLDFGTTNTVAARADGGESQLVMLDTPAGPAADFRSALCFWEDEDAGGVAAEAGPWAIAEFLAFPQGSRFLQSFKSVAANAGFDSATIFERRYKFEALGRLYLEKLAARAGGALDTAARIVIGRPVVYAGHAPDEALARLRYDAMFGPLRSKTGAALHYVYEPMGAAFSYATRITEPATVLVADFGGGTSDFSVVQIAAPGSGRRCVPLGHAGVGIAGDRFDARIIDELVTPLLGRGGSYRSFDKILDIPPGFFADFADWSRLALMHNRRTLAELDKLRRAAVDADAIGRMIAIIEGDLGFRLHQSVGQVKRDLSEHEEAIFRFEGGGLAIAAEVSRGSFEGWIAPEIARIDAAIDSALATAGTAPAAIDRVFLTGGSSLVPRIRRLFTDRFGADRIASGGELTSIAHGLALIGQQDDIAEWAA